MNRGIRIQTIWFDGDIIELKIDVSDGEASFTNRAYVGRANFDDTISRLDVFKDNFYGGLMDVSFGEFGPEYANGAFRARFHYPKPGRLYISCQQESEYFEFAEKVVASCATIYLQSKPALLDRFVGELRGLASGVRDNASLEAV